MRTLLLAFAFALGCWCLQQQAVLPDWTGSAIVLPLGVLALAAKRRRYRAVAILCGVAFCVLTGFFWAAAVSHWKLASQLPLEWVGRDVVIEGVVADLPQHFARGGRVRLDVVRVITPGAQVPRTVMLNWYEERGPQPGDAPALHAGQRWRLTVRLQRPHGNYNPHGFDVERSLLERGVRATGYVRPVPPPRIIADFDFAPGYAIARLREEVRERLLRALPGAPYGGVIVALTVGDQQAIAPAQWTVFTRTGVNHLMSISGLHITMVASLVLAITGAVWRRIPALASRLAAHQAAAAAGLAAALGYALLAGFAVPAQRTVYMAAVIALALWSGWRWPAPTVLGAALGTVVLIDPLAAASPGFWLSFGAVAALILVTTGHLRRPGLLAAWLQSQWTIMVALAPLLIALFQQVSIVSPLANAVAIPVISLLVVPLALLAIVPPLGWLAQLAHAALVPCMSALAWLAQFPGAAWQQHAPVPWAVGAALLGALWLMLPRGFPARWIGLIAMLPMFVMKPAGPAADELWVTALDVGQGQAVVVRTSQHALLFDAGPSYSSGGDAGERVVVPYLRGQGVSRLDMLIVSHDDSDHAGGALSVLSALPVARTLSSLPEQHPITEASATASLCRSGQRWHWDGVSFEMLHPTVQSYNQGSVKDNDRSCVLRVVSGAGSVLVAGDIEQRSERELLIRVRGELSSALLIAPHHGSRTSSTPDFIRAVGARQVLFSIGYRNRFGHPHPQVVARYRASGAQSLRTDVSGAVTFRFAKARTTVEQWRWSQPRFWHGI
jgi:competence protein ComEC